MIWLFAECSLNPPASTLRLPRVSYAIPTHALSHSMAAAGVATLLTSMIIVQNAGTETVNGQYFPQDPAKIPYGDLVCKQNNWNTLELWKKLNGNSVWYEKEDGAYVYYNNGDRRWWIDDKDGLGVYIADTDGSNAATYPSEVDTNLYKTRKCQHRQLKSKTINSGKIVCKEFGQIVAINV